MQATSGKVFRGAGKGREMNKRQKLAVIVGVCVIVGMCVYPPYAKHHPFRERVKLLEEGEYRELESPAHRSYWEFECFACLWTEPEGLRSRIDMDRLKIQVFAVLVLTVGVTLILGRPKP